MRISLKLDRRYKQTAEAQINISYVKKIFCMRDQFVIVESVKRSVNRI